ncbi:MAG: hypothetical protein KME05_14890 [Gloeocapsa sp. UFS-A4-WI-NPMV-4B04]|jgi:hypothetical protein|nr:hypothetical protein [Gloeocapsa sp. UFS-A4-WI-NPMV-4B04]
MIDNSVLYLMKHYFKLYLYFAGSFGIFCFTTQGVPPLTQTLSLGPKYERAMTNEAVDSALNDCGIRNNVVPTPGPLT